jgi:hypothetical protein
MVVHDKPGLPGLSFAWKSFTPIAEHIRIRLLNPKPPPICDS